MVGEKRRKRDRRREGDWRRGGRIEGLRGRKKRKRGNKADFVGFFLDVYFKKYLCKNHANFFTSPTPIIETNSST